jgi:hypothetical protein
MAFLKLSVCVVGEGICCLQTNQNRNCHSLKASSPSAPVHRNTGDELPVHDDDEDDEGENAMEMTKCLMPPSLEQEKRWGR